MVFDKSLLFEKLNELDVGKRYVELINSVYDKFKDHLEAINYLFGDYTDHGIKHSESVLRILEDVIISENRIKNAEWIDVDGRWRLKFDEDLYLTLEEIVLLLLAVLLHDIGMSPEIEPNRRAKEILERLKSEVDEDKRKELQKELDELKDEIRDKHNEISREFVEKEIGGIFEKYNFESYIEVLGFVVEAHRFDPIDIFRRDDREFFKYLNIRRSLIAFLLELADDMDIGYWRVDAEKFKTLARYLGSENIKHMFLNKSVRFAREIGAAVYKVTMPDVKKIGEKNFAELMGLLFKWWEKIETRIDRAKFYGGEALNRWREVLPSKIEFDVSYFSQGSIARVDLSRRFEIDRNLLADLLSSEVYLNEWTLAFRELIGNAFDAIKRRWVEGDRFSPKVFIDVKIDDEWVIIAVEDNGIGMSPRDVEDYLLRVGRSFYRELREKDKDFAAKICPMGYYGIGFLSCFMLLKNNGDFDGLIEVESKRKGYNPVKILIFNPNLPVVWMKTDRDVGTTVRIKCRREGVMKFFWEILEFVKEENRKVFPFRHFEGVNSSVFERLNLRIPVEIRINNKIIWDGVVEPDVKGDVVEEVEACDGKYRLIILKEEVIEVNYAIVNGIRCRVANKQFRLFDGLTMDGQIVGYILIVEAEDVRFTELAKRRIMLPEKAVGELFRKLEDKLKRKGLYLNVGFFILLTTDKEFEEVGAMGFVRSCLRFRDIDGNFVSLEEIEKMGKEPIVINSGLFERKEFKDFFNERKLHPLLTKFLTTCQKVSDYLENCKDCDACIFGLSAAAKIKDEKLKNLLLEKFGDVVAFYGHSFTVFFILDNAFVKTICELWRSGELDVDETVKLLKTIRYMGDYATIKDVEELVEDDEELKKIYEKIKTEMGNAIEKAEKTSKPENRANLS